MDKSKTKIEKVGVGWKRVFKNSKFGLKLSIRKEILVAFENKRKVKDTDPDYVIVKFLDEPDEKKVEVKEEVKKV